MATLRGTSGPDHLRGSDDDDRIVGLGGDDELGGGGGNDVLVTGTGTDYASGEAGDDRLYGGVGSDSLFGDQGRDRLFGQDDDDRLFGGENDDHLDGGAGQDGLFGEEGDDVLVGGGGDDRIDGDEGQDRMTGGAGRDVFGFTLRTLSGLPPASAVAAPDVITDFTQAGPERDNLFLGNGGLSGDLAFNGAIAVRPVLGAVLGFGGDGIVDVFTTRFGGSTFVLADLDDDGSLGADDFVVRLGGLIDLAREDFSTNRGAGPIGLGVRGTSGRDVLSTPDETGSALFGVGGNDVLTGGASDDLIRGGDGRDVIRGGDGRDTLYGDDGDDRIESSGDVVTMSGGDGNDVLDNRGGTGGQLNGDAGNDTIRGFGGLYGGDGDDRIEVTSVDGRGAFVIAGLGDDVVNGGEGDDTIYGGTGNFEDPPNPGSDLLRGRGGNDTLVGGGGVDRIDGGAGNDTIYGEGGNDVLDGREGNDTIHGGDGDDVVMLSRGGDTLYGDAGKDHFVLGSVAFGGTIADLQISDRIDLSRIDADTTAPGHQDFVFRGENLGNHYDDISGLQYYVSNRNTYLGGDTDGDGRIDFAIGIAGTVTLRPEQILGISHAELRGTDDDDRLLGSSGDDVLQGFNGADTLRGNLGGDRLTGGEGADRFDFTGMFGRDVVADFDPTIDVLAFDDAVFEDAADLLAHARPVGADTLVDDGQGNKLFLKGVTVAELETAQLVWI